HPSHATPLPPVRGAGDPAKHQSFFFARLSAATLPDLRDIHFSANLLTLPRTPQRAHLPLLPHLRSARLEMLRAFRNFAAPPLPLWPAPGCCVPRNSCPRSIRSRATTLAQRAPQFVIIGSRSAALRLHRVPPPGNAKPTRAQHPCPALQSSNRRQAAP